MKFVDFVDNRGYGIIIKYPSEWEKKENVLDTVVVFLSPLEDNVDKFRENLSIMIRPIDFNADLLKDHVEYEIEQLKSTLPKFQLVKKAKMRISRNSGYKIIFQGKKKGVNVKLMQCYVIINRIIYLLTYTAEVDKFNKFIKAIKKMIKSFRVIN
ncbi:MAG: DUF1795 domain-containing protein [Promethearchaeota archaeon]|nr:MAG: DUF1795 domain-containing protein [Candidatus Lokiarchaeota archaeon]